MALDAERYAVVDRPERERFEIAVGDEVAGFTEYRRHGGLIAFIHTEIAPEFEGRGLASRLIAAALDAAREEGLAVLPFCPFVRGYIARHHEYLDLVPEAQRGNFDLPADG
jgi:uncharacterized protein